MKMMEKENVRGVCIVGHAAKKVLNNILYIYIHLYR